MNITLALIGNPNCGKTTLFNQLTGSNQHVGNFPGVTVDKKEGSVRAHPGVTVVDLPGIYSLSPYTAEEVVSRDFLLHEHPAGVINIVDATTLERNLYLTLQLMELERELGKPLLIRGKRKLTLTEAEAVAGIIDAASARRLEIGVRQAGGSLSRRIDGLYGRLVTLAASLRAYIDYPDEDLADLSEAETAAELSAVKAELDALADSHRYGRAVSEGVRTVLVGRTNTGKSSLLNLLLGFERALVSDEAGTTRDVVSAPAVVCGIPLLLADTAGLRAGAGEVERAGIRKSIEQLEQAELVLAVFDLSQPLTDEDYALADRIRALGKAAQTIAVFNKLDLAAQAAPPALFETQVCLSARTGAGREALENAVGALYGGLEPDMDSVVTSARQAAALRRASEALDGALCALGDGAPDASGTELDAAIAALGELDGRSVSEAVVAEIFSRFCVGK